MKTSKVAKRYARALMGLSADHAQLEKWGAELERLAKIVDAPETVGILDMPTVTLQARVEAVGKIAERLDLSYPVRAFAIVAARHSRIREISAMAERYGRMLDDLLGRTRATITFAREPGANELQSVVAALEAIAQKRVIATTRIDGALVGGAVAELEGKIYDGSLATRLAEAEKLLGG
ncbi:ATP synthase F1 subunit delta [bacterium]|nr:ATP synthase F1 subunit delta [bacterium]